MLFIVNVYDKYERNLSSLPKKWYEIITFNQSPDIWKPLL